MISYIKGKVILKKDNFIIVKIGNIGIKVFVLQNLEIKENEIELFTYTIFREESFLIYGFSSYDELELFEVLISVSGIGPKAGLKILSLADSKTIKTAIAKEDAEILTKVSGIGRKTAERVIFELKSKFAASHCEDWHFKKNNKELMDNEDVIDALVELGYSRREARKSLSKIPPEINNVAEKIKFALKELGRNV